MKKAKRVQLQSGVLSSIKAADKMLSDREKAGMPDLPHGHPALRAMQVNKTQKTKTKKNIEDTVASKKKEDIEKTKKLIADMMVKVVGLDKELHEIYDMSAACVELLKEDPSFRIRFSRLGRIIFSFHASLRDCCGPLENLFKARIEQMESEE